LAIDWDKDAGVLTYVATVDDPSTNNPVTYTAFYTPVGKVGPPTIPDKRIDSRIQLNLEDPCPTFTWPAVPGANSYRVRLFANNGGLVLWNEIVGGTSFKVPQGVLKPNSGLYQFQVNAWDSHGQLDIDNGYRIPASTPYMTFFVLDGPPVSSPYLSFDNIGVNTFTDPEDGTYLNFYARVNDANGVPDNIKRVKVILPGDAEKILAYDPGEGGKYYSGIYSGEYYGEFISGRYTFMVEDWDGNTYQTFEDLDASSIDPVVLLSPKNGDVLDITKLPIRWSPVPYAAFYRVFIYGLDWNTVYAVSTHIIYPSRLKFQTPMACQQTSNRLR
jgi:hypothetical protein